MNIWKRNAVIATVVLFISVAVFLNWSYGRGDDAPAAGDYVLFEDTMTGRVLSGEFDAGAMSGAQTMNAGLFDSSGYFANARLNRQQARDTALTILRETSARPTATEDLRNRADEEIGAIALNALAEARIESLVIAKGFADCVAFLYDGGADLVVAAPPEGLQPVDVARMADIIISETGLRMDNITIVPIG
jgi:stage III sporulation protein AH